MWNMPKGNLELKKTVKTMIKNPVIPQSTHFFSLFRVLHPKPSLVGNHIVFSSESKLLLLLLQ